MNSNSFVSANHIIANVAKTVGDDKFRMGFSLGWYRSQIQDALQELAFDTFYETITLDYDVPDNLRLEFPPNVFNPKEIYVYNGDGCCTPSNSQIVHWKRQFNNKGKGDGYTSRVKEGGHNQSPFVANLSDWDNDHSIGGTKYFYNIQNGTIMFSSSCRGFRKVRLIVNGMGGAIGEIPVIPRFFEQAIKDWVKERFYEAMIHRDPRLYKPLFESARDQRVNMRNGTWKDARLRISRMDSLQKDDLNEYISAIYHK